MASLISTQRELILSYLNRVVEPVPVTEMVDDLNLSMAEVKPQLDTMAVEFEVWMGCLGPQHVLHVAPSHHETGGP